MNTLTRNVLVLIICSLFALHLLDLVIGVRVIIPTNTSWMFEGGDWSQHQLGWEFFRHTQWQFPLTAIPGFFYPMGANIGYTDSIPLLAFPFKLLSPILPTEFQYFGIWMLLSLTLQGFFTYRIAKNFQFSTLNSLLWAGLVILSPPLLRRIGHTALTTHWLFLYSWLQYQQKIRGPRTFIPLILSLFIHPYLTAMVFATKLFDWFRERPWVILKHLIVSAVMILSIWWLLGYFSTPSSQLLGDVGYYDTYVLSLIFGPPEMTDFLDRYLTYPEFRADGASEGASYLGLGLISALFLSILSFPKILPRKKDSLRLIASSILIFGIILFASQLEILKHYLAYIPIFPNLMSSFRTNGRFLWILWYGIVYLILRYFPRTSMTTPLLLLFFGMQYLDLQPLFDFAMRPEQRIYSEQSYLEIERALPLESIQTIHTFPPYDRSLHYVEDYVLFSLVSARNEKNITNGYLARHDKTKAAQIENQYLSDLYTSSLSPDTVYVSSQHFDKPLLHAYDQSPEKVSGMCFGAYRAITPVSKK
jgi:hypothetical protein